MVGAVEELTIKISASDYDAFTNDATTDIEDLVDEVVDVAEDLGELVAETLQDQPWQCSGVDIQPDRLVLPAGLGAGLQPNQRLFVFEGQRTFDGLQGKRFFVPGKRIAEVRITAINDDLAEAAGDDIGAVRVGDIVAPVR